ncbi:hypothetical protein [Krasilnikovia cinnamomea]|uniref:hypothetical protein n=1 Tax=Krasilnikovia cinnamomea TaxID=349313 RepID=UPI00102BB001|nr:hypothetical protein [Krasilnikovia cinnamomea]
MAAVVSAVVLTAAGAVAGTAVGAPARAAAPGRAMWLWNRADPATVITWATDHDVREIFTYVEPNVAASGDLTRLKDLKKRADRAGITLSALGGEPGWVFDIEGARAWQKSALGTKLFARSHVDVEPYALNAWSTDQPGTVAAFVALLDALQADDARPLEVDVPFWYDTIPLEGGTLADAVLARVDAVTVMSYRDTATGPNSIMDVGADMLLRGGAAGIPVRLAAETASLPDCPYCTFFEEGQQRLANTLDDVDVAAAGYPAFAGIAVHHYGSWSTLRDSP